MKLYLVRHGKTVLNEQGLVQGWSDSPLTAEGRAVIETLGRGFADVPFSHAFCSDFVRTRQTAELILAQNPEQPTITQLPDLREINFGKYESGPNEVMWRDALGTMGLGEQDDFFRDRQTFTASFDAIARNDETGVAENAAAFAARQRKALAEITAQVEREGGNHVLIVSHGGAIPCIVHSLGGRVCGEMENGSVTRIDYDRGVYTVESVGDPTYMERGKSLQTI